MAAATSSTGDNGTMGIVAPEWLQAEAASEVLTTAAWWGTAQVDFILNHLPLEGSPGCRASAASGPVDCTAHTAKVAEQLSRLGSLILYWPYLAPDIKRRYQAFDDHYELFLRAWCGSHPDPGSRSLNTPLLVAVAEAFGAASSLEVWMRNLQLQSLATASWWTNLPTLSLQPSGSATSADSWRSEQAVDVNPPRWLSCFAEEHLIPINAFWHGFSYYREYGQYAVHGADEPRTYAYACRRAEIDRQAANLADVMLMWPLLNEAAKTRLAPRMRHEYQGLYRDWSGNASACFERRMSSAKFSWFAECFGDVNPYLELDLEAG